MNPSTYQTEIDAFLNAIIPDLEANTVSGNQDVNASLPMQYRQFAPHILKEFGQGVSYYYEQMETTSTGLNDADRLKYLKTLK